MILNDLPWTEHIFYSRAPAAGIQSPEVKAVNFGLIGQNLAYKSSIMLVTL